MRYRSSRRRTDSRVRSVVDLPGVGPSSGAGSGLKWLGAERVKSAGGDRMKRLTSLWALALALAAAPQPAATPGQEATGQTSRRPDVAFIPTPAAVIQEMLTGAHVGKDDVVYDLGCGDGRIVIAAARQFGARGVGVDIDPVRIREARKNAEKAGVAGLVTFLNQDLFQTNFKEATVVMLYLLPDLNLKLRPKLLAELEPGTRIVSHAWDMGDWTPERSIDVNGRLVFFWTVPKR
jgi:SAM-dependent methyltransferase